MGVNRFRVDGEELAIELLRIDPEVERRQRERLRELRGSRSAAPAEQALTALAEGARGDANLMPLIIACARAYVTEGEIIATLKEVFGEYREAAIF